MNDFTLLWAKMLRSSIWIKGSKETRLLWVAFLCLKDRDGQVFSSVVGLADAAKLSVEECRKALKVLLSPDPDDSSGVDEGRRLREIQGGWEIVNHDLYRFTTEAKREFWKSIKAEQRRKAAEENDPEFKKAKAKEYVLRRKPGKREMKLEGAKAGACQAINEGLAQ